ncbi:phosphoribosyltransferase [Halodesulfurarchaeum sp.]|uniref:phosphoribosyltransferase n=1 Tax=Halodesulfurarchaeum sp. TaxID=1980530 RepID=UPI001BBC395F|nr:phosphoribosyltransferase [Halodesulfurarchaeum sp.]
MTGSSRFTDRREAGQELGDALQALDTEFEIVLTIPRGGLPLGRAVADVLAVPLDIVVAQKIGAPNNPEYAIGAVTNDGTVWRNEAAINRTGADETYFETQRESEARNAQEKAERYRGGSQPPKLEGKTVAVVDDGMATGSTMRAALKMLSDRGPARIVVGVPVGPLDTIQELEALVDDLVCLETPSHFRAVGQYYDRFDQVTDDEAMAYLE